MGSPRAVSTSHGSAGLPGRTYSIPFEDVWQGSLRLVRQKLRGWSLLHADDLAGIVQAAIKGLHGSLDGTVEIRIALDRNAQTRVDVTAVMPSAVLELGLDERRIRRFLDGLDREALREHERRRAASLAPS